MISVSVWKRKDCDALQLAWRDPLTNKWRRKSAKTSDWKVAQRRAVELETELRQMSGQAAISWDVFRDRYEREYFADLKESTRANYTFGLNKFEKLMGHPVDVRMINASVVSQYIAKLRDDVKSQSSVATNLMVLRAALNWAASVGLIQSAPKIRIPAIESRGRPISLVEFIGLMQRIRAQNSPDEVPSIHRLLMVMWLGGLRIGEAIKLSVDSGPVQVDFAGRRPMIAWGKGGQKNQRIERTPIAPDFARYLKRFDSGPVVNSPLAKRTLSKRINEAGNGTTPHDLRRTFGTRWALRVHPLVLKAMMRHKSMETTLKYYVDLEADKVADQLWENAQDGKRFGK